MKPRFDTPAGAAWPLANPILTCASVTDVPSNFVADPFLFPGYAAALAAPRVGSPFPPMHLFFETKSNPVMRGEIGVAESLDGGATWRHLGIALSEPWHLSYPFVFEWRGEAYMLPEGSGSGGLRLYKAAQFPLKWEFVAEVLNRPLVDASLVQWEDRWYIFGSDPSRPGHQKNAELQIFHAESPLGPWMPHFITPVMSRDPAAGARMAGRIVLYRKKLYRFGQDCSETYGRAVVAYKIEALSPTEFKQRRVTLRVGRSRQGAGAWNGVRRHHVDAMELPDGSWLAVMDGDYQKSNPLTQPLLRKTALAVVLWVAAAAVLGWRRSKAGRGGLQPGLPSWGSNGFKNGSLMAVEDSPARRKRRNSPPGQPVLRVLGPPGKTKRLWEDLLKGVGGSRRAGAVLQASMTSVQGLCYLALALALAVFIIVASLGAAYYVSIVWEQPNATAAVAVNGAFSKFTVLILSHAAWQTTLEAVIQHYSRCPSVAEVVVVWNGAGGGRGTGSGTGGESPPPPQLQSYGVPVRVRAELENSLNNRFKPDPLLRTRAVLSLDDDVLMRCVDVERAFAMWRLDPDRITGFFPRLVTLDPPRYLGERDTFAAGKYNVLLTGGAFLDADRAFTAYWSDSNAAGRAAVDRRFNCEDLLMNFVWTAQVEREQALSAVHGQRNRTAVRAAGTGTEEQGQDASVLQFVQPKRRLDISAASSVGLSRNGQAHRATRVECLQEFAELFEDFPLREASIARQGLVPLCSFPGTGCIYT